MSDEQPSRPCVYFIQCGDMNLVKIGFTRGWPRDRMRDLQVGCPFELSLIYGVPCSTQKHESSWWRVFESRHERGEWFRLTDDEVMEAINAYYDVCGHVDRDARPLPHEMVELTRDGITKKVEGCSYTSYDDKGYLDFEGGFWRLRFDRWPEVLVSQ